MSATFLGNGDGALGTPVVRVNANGRTHLVFTGIDKQIHYRRGSDGTWDPDEIVPSPAPKNYQPHLALGANGRAQIVFVGETGQGSASYAIFFAARRARRWQETVRLSTESFAQLPRLAVAADGSLHVVYNRLGGAFQEIYYTRLCGAAWSAPQVIGSGFFPDLALDAQGQPVVVWNDKQALFCAQRAANGTWSAPQQLKAGDRPQTASIAFDASGAAHIIAQARKGDQQTLVHVRRAPDGTLSRGQRVPLDNLVLAMYPRLTIDCIQRVHVVYQAKSVNSGSEPWRVFSSVWDGTRWDAPARLDAPLMSSINQVPSADANGTVLALAWWARRGDALEMYADTRALDCPAPMGMTAKLPKRKTTARKTQASAKTKRARGKTQTRAPAKRKTRAAKQKK